MELLEELETRVVCGDGGMGTLLLEQGVPVDRCLEELCVTEPERVCAIHDDYVAAGARVIKTNTFGANAVRLSRFGFEDRVAEINRAAAHLAVRSAKGKTVCVAGSIGPLGITAEEATARGIDRAAVFREQTIALIDGGVQILFFETFMDCTEMELAVRAAPASECTIICSFACDREGRLQSGMLLVDAFARMRDLGARIVGVNCLNGPYVMVQVLQRLPAGDLLSAYANAGYPKYIEGRYIYPTTPDFFASAAHEMAAAGARLIGGCCGTTPRDVAAIATAVADLRPVPSKPPRLSKIVESASASKLGS